MLITASILGTLVGGMTSAIPGILNFFMRREELKNAARMAEINKDIIKFKADHEIDIIDARADAFEGESLRKHDSSLDGKGVIGGLRASVRPVITYLFFLTFVLVKFMTIYTFMQSGAAGDWLGSAIAWTDVYPLIWDDNTQGIFGAIMGFWFGSRTIEKLQGY